MAHVAEKNIMIGVVGGIKFGFGYGMFVDGDLTSLAAVDAAVDVKTAKLHSSHKSFGNKTKGSLNLADQYQAGYTAGGSAVAIYTILPNQSPQGFFLRA